MDDMMSRRRLCKTLAAIAAGARMTSLAFAEDLSRRGREYTSFFQAQKVGTYRLECQVHAPSMTASIVALPR